LAESQALARRLLGILEADSDRLARIDRYARGEHDDPYMPESADAEYKLLAKRAVCNWIPLLISTPAQALYVDAVRRSKAKTDVAKTEWDHWQRSRLDERQLAVHRGALTFGHSFVVTERHSKLGWRSRGLSALRTSALFEDAANDNDPVAALHVTRWPSHESRGQGLMWDQRYRYEVTFPALWDKDKIRVRRLGLHGLKECPVTRFAAHVDLDGRTVGVAEPVIPAQDRINQTIFDLLLAQTYASTQVRFVTGMAPPLERDPETGSPKLDEHGNPIPLKVNHNAKRFLFAEDPDVKFGSLPASPLNGFLDSIELHVRHLAAITQTPPHHVLGQIANISAEALLAAETALSRMVEEFRNSFGESWERVFRLAAAGEGATSSAEDYAVEVLWRDMEMRSLGQSADGLGKLADSLGIPKRGLWSRVPDVTGQEIEYWEELAREQDYEARLASLLSPASPPDDEPTPAEAVA
jgi:hypothetical protein